MTRIRKRKEHRLMHKSRIWKGKRH